VKKVQTLSSPCQAILADIGVALYTFEKPKRAF
jgi:hypothetical protein